MPTYDYRCDACGHEFEQFQSITAKPLRKCPACEKSKLKRLIGTGAGVIFKGSGFWQTDYRSQSYKDGAKADQEAASGKTDKASTSQKTDSGTDKKADSSTDKKPAKAAPKSEGKD